MGSNELNWPHQQLETRVNPPATSYCPFQTASYAVLRTEQLCVAHSRPRVSSPVQGSCCLYALLSQGCLRQDPHARVLSNLMDPTPTFDSFKGGLGLGGRAFVACPSPLVTRGTSASPAQHSLSPVHSRQQLGKEQAYRAVPPPPPSPPPILADGAPQPRASASHLRMEEPQATPLPRGTAFAPAPGHFSNTEFAVKEDVSLSERHGRSVEPPLHPIDQGSGAWLVHEEEARSTAALVPAQVIGSSCLAQMSARHRQLLTPTAGASDLPQRRRASYLRWEGDQVLHLQAARHRGGASSAGQQQTRQPPTSPASPLRAPATQGPDKISPGSGVRHIELPDYSIKPGSSASGRGSSLDWFREGSELNRYPETPHTFSASPAPKSKALVIEPLRTRDHGEEFLHFMQSMTLEHEADIARRAAQPHAAGAAVQGDPLPFGKDTLSAQLNAQQALKGGSTLNREFAAQHFLCTPAPKVSRGAEDGQREHSSAVLQGRLHAAHSDREFIAHCLHWNPRTDVSRVDTLNVLGAAKEQRRVKSGTPMRYQESAHVDDGYERGQAPVTSKTHFVSELPSDPDRPQSMTSARPMHVQLLHAHAERVREAAERGWYAEVPRQQESIAWYAGKQVTQHVTDGPIRGLVHGLVKRRPVGSQVYPVKPLSPAGAELANLYRKAEALESRAWMGGRRPQSAEYVSASQGTGGNMLPARVETTTSQVSPPSSPHEHSPNAKEQDEEGSFPQRPRSPTLAQVLSDLAIVQEKTKDMEKQGSDSSGTHASPGGEGNLVQPLTFAQQELLETLGPMSEAIRRSRESDSSVCEASPAAEACSPSARAKQSSIIQTKAQSAMFTEWRKLTAGHRRYGFGYTEKHSTAADEGDHGETETGKVASTEPSTGGGVTSPFSTNPASSHPCPPEEADTSGEPVESVLATHAGTSPLQLAPSESVKLQRFSASEDGLGSADKETCDTKLETAQAREEEQEVDVQHTLLPTAAACPAAEPVPRLAEPAHDSTNCPTVESQITLMRQENSESRTAAPHAEFECESSLETPPAAGGPLAGADTVHKKRARDSVSEATESESGKKADEAIDSEAPLAAPAPALPPPEEAGTSQKGTPAPSLRVEGTGSDDLAVAKDPHDLTAQTEEEESAKLEAAVSLLSRMDRSLSASSVTHSMTPAHLDAIEEGDESSSDEDAPRTSAPLPAKPRESGTSRKATRGTALLGRQDSLGSLDSMSRARKLLGLQANARAPVKKLARMYSMAAKDAQSQAAIISIATAVLARKRQQGSQLPDGAGSQTAAQQ